MSFLTDIKKTINLMLKDSVTKSRPLHELKDKVVLITGASSGIGKETAVYLLEQGAKVAVISRDIKKLNDLFGSFDQNNVLFLQANINESKQTKDAVNRVIEKFSKIDVLINNAGINIDKALEQCTENDINSLIDTNIKGTVNMCIAVLPHMKSMNSGTIINIGSKISHNTNVSPNKVLYATSKYAIEGMSFALNKELKGTNIRSMCLMPGTVNTFFSTKSGNYMAPKRLAELIGTFIIFDDIDFEGVVFKSKDQDI